MRRKYKEVEKIEDWKNEKEKKYTGRSFEGEKKTKKNTRKRKK